MRGTCCHYDDGHEDGYEKAIKDVHEALQYLDFVPEGFDIRKAVDITSTKVTKQRKLYEASEKQVAA